MASNGGAATRAYTRVGITSLMVTMALSGCLWTPDTSDIRVTRNGGVVQGVRVTTDWGDPAGVSLGGPDAQVFATPYVRSASTGAGLFPQPFRIATWRSDLSQPDNQSGLAEALTTPPTWSDGRAYWAPSVRKIGGRYVMVFSASRSIGGTRLSNCLGEASSASPSGPFVAVAAVEWCDPPTSAWHGRAYYVDPYLFVDGGGTLGLLWSIEPQDDGPNAGTSEIVSEELSNDGERLLNGGPSRLVSFSDVDSVMNECQLHGGSMARPNSRLRAAGAPMWELAHIDPPAIEQPRAIVAPDSSPPRPPGCATDALGRFSYIENPSVVSDPYNGHDLVVSIGTWDQPGTYYSIEMPCPAILKTAPGDSPGPLCFPSSTQNGGEFMENPPGGEGNSGGASFLKDGPPDGNYELWAWADTPGAGNQRDVYATPTFSADLNPPPTTNPLR